MHPERVKGHVMLIIMTSLIASSLHPRVTEGNSTMSEIIVGIYLPSPDWKDTLNEVIQRLWDQTLYEPLNASRAISYRVSYMIIEGSFDISVQGIQSALTTLTRESISVLIGPYDSVAKIVTSELNIAYLVIDCRYDNALPIMMTSHINMADLTAENVLYLSPRCDTVHKAAVDVAALYSWKGTAVLYDSIQGLLVAERLISAPEMVTGAWPLKGGAREKLYQLLEIKRLGVDQLMVACETKAFSDLLEQALKLSMLSDRYSWIYVSLNALSIDFQPYVYTEVNLTSFYLPNIYSQPSANVEPTTAQPNPFLVTDSTTRHLNSSRQQSREIDHRSGNIFLESLVYDALRLLRDSTELYLEQPGASVICEGRCAPLSGDRLINIMKSELKRVGGIDVDSTNTRSNTSLKVLTLASTGLDEMGLWRETGSSVRERLKMRRRADRSRRLTSSSLKRGVQRIVTLVDSPFVQYKSDHDSRTGNDRFEGFLIDLIEEISHRLGFRYELYESPDGNYGSKNSSGHWNGMIQELIVGNAAMCLGAISITSDRLGAIDFSKPFKMKTFNLLMKKPEVRATIFQFLSPLSARVWIAIFVSLVGVSVLLHVMDRVSPNDPADPRDGSGSFNLPESFWFVYGSLVGGGTERIPRTYSGRLLSSAWWFFGLIIISSYTANLAAFLTISKIDSPIQSVDDLAKQATIKYGTVRNTYAMSMFKNSDLEVLKKMWAMMQLSNSLVNNTAEGIERAKQGNYAFIWDSPINKHIANHDCDVIATGEPFDEKGYGIGVPDRAPYREQLSKMILVLSESGYIKKLENKWWDAGECEDFSESAKSNDNPELDMFNVAGVFLLLGSGAVMGVVVCLLEYVVARIKGKHKINSPTVGSNFTDQPELEHCQGNGERGIRLKKKGSPDDGCPSYNSTTTASSHNINEIREGSN